MNWKTAIAQMCDILFFGAVLLSGAGGLNTLLLFTRCFFFFF